MTQLRCVFVSMHLSWATSKAKHLVMDTVEQFIILMKVRAYMLALIMMTLSVGYVHPLTQNRWFPFQSRLGSVQTN